MDMCASIDVHASMMMCVRGRCSWSNGDVCKGRCSWSIGDVQRVEMHKPRVDVCPWSGVPRVVVCSNGGIYLTYSENFTLKFFQSPS